ncbi:MAG: hypothetical protein HZB53_18445 [Chloroflexi bacterium]|nr:hypothetical protein [Chloroflexota bacterium]
MNTNTRLSRFPVLILFLTLSAVGGACAAVTGNADTAASSATPFQRTLTPNQRTTISPTATPVQDVGVAFRLSVGSFRVYQVTRYQAYPIPETMTVTRVVTDTVVNVETIAPYVVATIHRSEHAETAVAVPASMLDILMPAGSRNYWLIAKGNRLYRQDNKLDLSALDEALLELVFPLTLGAQWYQSDLLAKSNPTPRADAYMLRKVTDVGAVTVPAGHFDSCYFLQEEWAGTTFENWYCPAVGWVDRKADHHGTPEGWREVLIHYQMNR